ncbi:MAG: molecular chaperone DnaJ [Nitrospiraceae bacterium]|nr:MAG: molecular chaperone DnaJ [Nitrospiraceae bacterium]
MKDYYDILGVSRDANADDLKRAFRQLALKYHPDRNPDNKESEEKFKEVNEAYSCLSDSQKRAHYDRFGTSEGMGGGGYGPFTAGAGFGDIFEDIFGDFFGNVGGTRRQRPAKGSDLRYDLDISLSEAVFGTEKTIDFPKWETCEECKGNGSAPGKSPETCTSCKGTGHIRFQQGFFSVSKSCGKCQGTGKIITHPCKKCKGSGRVQEQKSISLKIPAGVDIGSRLKISGEGEPGEYGGPYGDLYVVLNIESHPFFKREGTEIFCEVPVSFPQAALGAEIEVPTIDGTAKLKIPHGTQSGKLFTIKGKGAPRVGGSQRGNQIVRIYVEVPTKLSSRQKELLEEFASLSGDEVTKGFKEKLKDLFTSVEN